MQAMDLRRCAQDHRVDLLDGQAVGEVGRHVPDAVLVGYLLCLGEVAADERDDLHTVNELDGIQMLDAERAGPGECHFDGHAWFSRIRWPTAVFDAGT
jgi:hypothetical protein